MRLGIVSDSHGHVDQVRPAVRMLESLAVDRVLHCGDIGSLAVVEQFAAWPGNFVFGNCDYDRECLAAGIQAAGQTCHGTFGRLAYAGRRIALLHSDNRREFDEATTGGAWDLVCYGHTHVAKIETCGTTLVVNPGALYRANPHSLAIVDLPELQVSVVNL